MLARFRPLFLPFLLSWVMFILYGVFSFSRTDPNLVFTSQPIYWGFQQWMWRVFYDNPRLLAWTYGGLMIGLVVTYGWCLRQLFQLSRRSMLPKVSDKTLFFLYVFFLLPLLGAYNALSHDIFNYLFNAKMVVVYHADPHQTVALSFPHDLWTRFMHNTHTAAPYGYGWTALSLVPYTLGSSIFSLTWLLFKLMGFASVLLLATVMWWLLQRDKKNTPTSLSIFLASCVLLNPLLLLEIIGNAHNDLWMIVPALWSIGLLATRQTKASLPEILLSGLLLVLSIGVKLATVTLIPLWLVLVLPAAFFRSEKLEIILNWMKAQWAFIASLSLFVPLLTAQSQWFHPWYLVWVLVWIPWINYSWWLRALLVLSISSLVRYIPWLLVNQHSPSILAQQIAITWVPFVCVLLFELGRAVLLQRKTKKK